MLLQRGKKIEITRQLQPESASILAQWIGCFGVVWNCKVAEDEKAYKEWLSLGRPDAARPEEGLGDLLAPSNRPRPKDL